MTEEETRGILEKQLQLLSKRSSLEAQWSLSELAEATDAMCNLVNYMAILGYGRD